MIFALVEQEGCSYQEAVRRVSAAGGLQDPPRLAESDYFRRHVGWLKGDPEPDWARLRPVEVGSLEDAEGAEDLAPALQAEIEEARDTMRAAMRSRGAWFHDNGSEVEGSLSPQEALEALDGKVPTSRVIA